MLHVRNLFSVIAALIMVAAVSLGATALAADDGSKDRDETKVASKNRVEAPLNLAVLIQDDVVARVGTELNVTRDFIRSLPSGSRVMVGYIGSGSLQVRQPFTDDLESANRALRIPIASTAASPFNPYVGVIEALRRFDNSGGKNRNAILLISDGLDLSRGADISSVANPFDMQRAIREAKRRNVAVYSFFAPTVALTSFNSSTAAIYGQGALSRLSNETGGRAFFQGTSFVTFDSYFERLRRTLNDQSGTAY